MVATERPLECWIWQSGDESELRQGGKPYSSGTPTRNSSVETLAKTYAIVS
jgi:hypothetical protein